MEDIGVVLSGGGTKSAAHIGFLKALNESGIFPKYISGASSGSLIGALYGAGFESNDMIQFLKSTPILNWFYYSTSKPGLFDTDKYRGHFEKYLSDANFESLNCKLYVTTTDIENGQPVVHTAGSLVDCVMASCSVPLVFSPVKIDGVLHSDGGIMNNFPVDPLLGLEGVSILGNYLSTTKIMKENELNTSYKVMSRAFDLTQQASCQYKFKFCDFVLAPKKLVDLSFLDKKGVDRAFEIGYEHTKKNIGAIVKTLSFNSLLDNHVHRFKNAQTGWQAGWQTESQTNRQTETEI